MTAMNLWLLAALIVLLGTTTISRIRRARRRLHDIRTLPHALQALQRIEADENG